MERKVDSREVVPPKYVYTEEDTKSMNMISLSIINGLMVKQIDPKIYMKLRVYLQDELDHETWGRNRNAIKQLNRGINEIDNYYARQEMIKRRKEELQRNMYSEQELEETVASILQGSTTFKIGDPRFQQALEQRLRDIKITAIQRRNGPVVDICENALRAMLEHTNSQKIRDAQETMEYNDQTKLRKMKSELEATKRKWDIRLNEVQNEYDREMERMEAQMIIAIERFEKERRNIYKQPYKPSLSIIELKRKKTYYKELGRMDEYESVSNELAELEIREKNEYKKRLNNEFSHKKAAIERKYKSRILEKQIMHQHTIDRLKAESNNEINTKAKNVSFYEAKLERTVNTMFDMSRSSASIPKLDEEDVIIIPALKIREPRTGRNTPRTFNPSSRPRITMPSTARTSRPSTRNSSQKQALTENQELYIRRKMYNRYLYTKSAHSSVRQ